MEKAGHADAAQQAKVPVACEWLMCLVVEPEFQEDRLADFQERFNNTWVPKFGTHIARFFYVWHALRQSGVVDWVMRAFWSGHSE
jgi:hypothetical protein